MRTGMRAGARPRLCARRRPRYADLATGRDKLVAGDYKTAIAELSKVTGKDRAAARILLARAQIETGDYAAAEGDARTARAGKDAQASKRASCSTRSA